MKNAQSEPVYQLNSDQDYYITSPAQGRSPDGKWAKGTRVARLKDAGGYTRARSSDGVTAWVATGALEAPESSKAAGAALPSSEQLVLTSEPVEDLERDLDPALQDVILASRDGKKLDPSFSFMDDNGVRRVEVVAKLKDPKTVPDGLSITPTEDETQIVTGTVDVSKIESVRRHPNVITLKAAKPVRPALQFSVAEILASADDLRRELPPGSGIDGKGVIVGIVDFGGDFAHRNFRNADGSTRLLCLWDQTGGRTTLSPSPFGYGREFDRTAIDLALRSPNPHQALSYRPEDRSHGAHVMDIAAGNGRATGHPGVAPGADLIFVELASNDFSDDESFGNSKRLIEAVDYIFRKAGDRPCVVNLSLGTHGGPHDGSTPAEQRFDEFLKKPNRAIVIAAGNSYMSQGHAGGALQAGERRTLRWRVEPMDPTPNELEVWYPGGAELAVRLITPLGQAFGPVGLGNTHVIRGNGQILGRIIHRREDPNNGANQINIHVEPALPSGEWKIELENKGGSAAAWDAWIERDDWAQSRFHPEDSDPALTIGSISCGRHTITVGSYTAMTPGRELSGFTAAGPTRDKREKPEVSAPGDHIAAARATTQGLTRMSGTSMASPHVAGLVALLYQAASLSGRKLSIQDVRTILSKAARANPPSSGHWDPRYGTGRVDAVAAIKLAMQVSVPPDSHKTASKGPSPLAMSQNGNGVFVDVLDAVGRAASRTNSVLRVQIEAEPAKAYDK